MVQIGDFNPGGEEVPIVNRYTVSSCPPKYHGRVGNKERIKNKRNEAVDS